MTLWHCALVPSLIFTALATSGLTLHFWGQQALKNEREIHAHLTQQRQVTADALHHLRTDLPQIKQDIADFLRADQRGWWRPEVRLRFSETLTQLAQKLQVETLDYGIAPRESFKFEERHGSSDHVTWLRSPLEIKIGVQQEEPLLRVIEAFPKLLGGISTLRECHVTRAQENNEPGHLVASCQGALYSIVDAGASDVTSGAGARHE